jgi:hypothetical protein
MFWFTTLFGLLFAASGLGVIWLVRRLTRVSRIPVPSAAWLGEVSVERYRPMLRLLSGDDLRFLRSQPGFHAGMDVTLRRQRCKIFRGYLTCLKGDFRRICSALQSLMLQSKYDRPDLASALVRAQVSFAAGLAVVEFRLVLYRWGLCEVDATALLRLFDSMQLELRTLVPQGEA